MFPQSWRRCRGISPISTQRTENPHFLSMNATKQNCGDAMMTPMFYAKSEKNAFFRRRADKTAKHDRRNAPNQIQGILCECRSPRSFSRDCAHQASAAPFLSTFSVVDLSPSLWSMGIKKPGNAAETRKCGSIVCLEDAHNPEPAFPIKEALSLEIMIAALTCYPDQGAEGE